MYAHTQQIYEEDCGIAVALTIAKQLKRNINLTAQYIKQLNIDENWVSLYDLKKLLALFGIFMEAYEVDNFKELLNKKFPMIIRTGKADSAHYVVIHNYSENEFIISDPAEPNIKRISYADLKKHFSGYALIIESTEKQQRLNKKNSQDIILKEIIKNSTNKYQKTFLYLINFLVMIAPLLITSEINKLSLHVNNLVIFGLIFVISLLSYVVILFINARLRLKISNNVVGNILIKSHDSELKNFGVERTDDDISNYFWNIFNAGNGLVNKYFIQYDICYAITLFILVGLIDIRSALILLLGAGLTVLLLVIPIQKLIKINKRIVESSGKWTDAFLKTLKGNVDIYAYNKENEVQNFYKNKTLNYFKHLKNITDQSTKITSIVDLSIFITIAISILLSKNSIIQGTNTVYMMFIAFQGLNTLINDYIGYISGKSEIDFIISRVAWDNTPKTNNDYIGSINHIESKNLIINIPNGNKIKYPDMVFDSGKTYLIIGENGVGKSTFVKLLLGINKTFSGDVSINNTNFLDKTFIKKMSYYANDLSVFNGTISSNILLSNFDDTPSKDFNIKKWNFKIDERKIIHNDNISSGQKQKVLLLRALNKDADVYIFDEPLTNLDEESKLIFLKSINTLKKLGKIILVISHEKPNYNFDKVYKLIGNKNENKKENIINN
ncbi:ATP-binding cassette domain-containing protein (plasmid) [Weissella hellenica]|nr:ATP-binding cassette domain-containing protein [Weissella hellenica]